MFDIDKLNMLYYLYDDNMEPILTEDQKRIEWAETEGKELLKAIVESDKYLIAMKKGLKNKQDESKEEFDYIKSVYADNKALIDEVLNEFDLTSLEGLKGFISEEKKYIKDNYVEGLYQEMIELYPDFMDKTLEEKKRLVRDVFDKEYISPEEIAEVKQKQLIVKRLFLELKGNKVDKTELEGINKTIQRLKKTVDTRTQNLILEESQKLWKPTKNTMYNDLLEAEVNLLKNKANFWQMAMPLGDDILKGEILTQIRGKVNEWKEKNPDVIWISEEETDYTDIMTVRLNSIKTELYLQGKAGVGIFALQGISHAISGTHPFVLNNTFKISNPYDIQTKRALSEPIDVSTDVPIKGYDNENAGLDNLLTLDGNLISELISQLLTSQVDIGKDPYAAELGLVLENLIVISYGIRRGIPLEVMMELVLSPAVQRFRQLRSREESIFSKASGGDKNHNLLKAEYISRFTSAPETMYQKDDTFYMSIEQNSKGLYQIKEGEKDVNIFMSYLYLSEQAKEYNKYIKATKFDNTTFKGKTELEIWSELLETLSTTDDSLFTKESLLEITANSITAPFAKIKKQGYGMFNDLYLNEKLNNQIKELQSLFTNSRDSEEDREIIERRVESGFITYLIQSKITEFLKEKHRKGLINKPYEINFFTLPAIVNEWITDIDKYTQNNTDNYALSEVLKVIPDYIKDVNAFFSRAVIRGKTETDEVIESVATIEEANSDIFIKIVLLPFLTSGLAPSNFNYQDLIPQQLRHELVTSSLESYLRQDLSHLKEDFLYKYLLKEYSRLPLRLGKETVIGKYKRRFGSREEEEAFIEAQIAAEENGMAPEKNYILNGPEIFSHIYSQIESELKEKTVSSMQSRLIANLAPSNNLPIITSDKKEIQVGQKQQEKTEVKVLGTIKTSLSKSFSDDIIKALLKDKEYEGRSGTITLVSEGIHNRISIKSRGTVMFSALMDLSGNLIAGGTGLTVEQLENQLKILKNLIC